MLSDRPRWRWNDRLAVALDRASPPSHRLLLHANLQAKHQEAVGQGWGGAFEAGLKLMHSSQDVNLSPPSTTVGECPASRPLLEPDSLAALRLSRLRPRYPLSQKPPPAWQCHCAVTDARANAERLAVPTSASASTSRQLFS